MKFRFAAALAGSIVLAPALAQTLPPATDNTLTVDEYTRRSMQALEWPWSKEDYVAGTRMLEGLDPDQVPRSDSPRSAPVLDRAFNLENFKPCASPSVALEERLKPCDALVLAAVRFGKAFIRAGASDAPAYDDELRALGFVHQAMTQVVGLLVQLSRTNASYIERLKFIADDVEKEELDSLTALEDHQHFSDAARLRLAKIFAGDFQQIAPALSDEGRAKVRELMMRIATTDSTPEVRAALAAFAAP